jgi:putative oxidoreductase
MMAYARFGRKHAASIERAKQRPFNLTEFTEEQAMNAGEGEPRLLIPQLKPFYDFVEPLSWVLVRLTAGLMIIPHGWPKLMSGVAATAAFALTRRGIEPAEPLAMVLIFLETVGGLCVALGLFTRFFAAAITIEMSVIVYHHLAKGFGWGGGGYEYPLMWGLIMFAVALRGGGPFSLDRKIGRQL